MQTDLADKSKKSVSRGFIYTVLGIFIVFFGMVAPPLGGPVHATHNATMQQGRQIGQMLSSYATDNVKNGNAYPDGASSTEVFQKLLDKNYCTDAAIFYVPMKGKIKPKPGQKLKPENVSWDVTGGVDSSSPDPIPLVFLTGWKVTYSPGSAAVPLVKPYPRWGSENPNPLFSEWHFAWSAYDDSGMAVFYNNNNASFRKLNLAPSGDGTIPNFVPPDFKPDGRNYRQLTPDGVMP